MQLGLKNFISQEQFDFFTKNYDHNIIREKGVEDWLNFANFGLVTIFVNSVICRTNFSMCFMIAVGIYIF